MEEKGYQPIIYRFMCLNSHYRKVLVFSYDALDNSKNAYQKLINKIKNMKEEGTINEALFKEYQSKFKKALEDDLNTALAITVLYDVLKDNKMSDATKLALVKDFDQVLSLNLIQKNNINEDLKQYVEEKIEQRKQAKLEKNYELADQIRKELEQKGILIKDTREGTTYEIAV